VDVGAQGIGQHTLALGGGEQLHPGVYFLRLTQEGKSLSTPVVILNR
jgi:hypothetical protein